MGNYYGMIEDTADEQRARDAWREARRLEDEERVQAYNAKVHPYFVAYGIFWLIVSALIVFNTKDDGGLLFLWFIVGGIGGFCGVVELLAKIYGDKK